MRLGSVSLWGQDVEAFRKELRLAEELGYEVLGVGDSPSAWQEMFVSLAVAAQATRRATLATMVTTPFMRHPKVCAGAMSSLQALSGGRMQLTIGSGGSAVASLGRKAAKTSELRDFTLATRDLLDGKPARFEGTLVPPLVHAKRMPLYLSADGPKSLALAGQIADGVVISIGLSLELVDQKLAIVRSAARQAGRDPGAIDFWGMSFVSVRDTRAAANADVTAFLAVIGGLGFKGSKMRAMLPPELLPSIEEMERRYDPTDHVVVGGKGARLVEELGLTEFLTGLSAITGSSDQVREHVAQLEKRGVSCVLAAMPGNADPEGTLRRFRQAIS